MAKKKVDPKDKAKRQKIILAVSGVLLVLLLAVQGPKTMKMMNAKPPADESHAPATTTTATAAAPSTAVSPTVAPTQATAQAVAVVTPEGIGIPNTVQSPVPGNGQLIAFDRFKTKDPFVQQVGGTDSAASTGASTHTAATATAPAAPSAPATAAPSVTPTAPAVIPVTPAAPAKPTTATISLDGTSEPVAVNASFPKASPVFKLVGLTKTVARIGIVGGTYSDGGATIKLRLGKTVTLMNTADGTRYKLRLVSVA